jgi:uncharacterized protein
MPTDSFPQIYHHVVHNLLSKLKEDLTYHSVYHTLDVLIQVERIAKEEGIGNEEELFLLKTAAMYHDTGFLKRYEANEEIGCMHARRDLPGFGLNERQIDRVCNLIMATRVPQSPQDKLEEIICDADLDYLGQDDFELISDSLRQEFLEYGVIRSNNEWEALQIKFLENHRYFTESSRQYRNPVKCKHLEKLRSA